MAVSTTQRTETKGNFKLEGIVTGLSKQNAFREGTTASGKDYKSIRFGVQTSPVNTVYVELFGMERDNVFAWNMSKKEGKQFSWSDRYDIPDEGYHLMGINVQLQVGLDGKVENRKTLAEFDAVQHIYDSLEDGDEVYINGRLEFSEYENNQQQLVQQTRYQIQSIGKTKQSIDFNSEKFEETSEFQQYIVVTDASAYDKETKKLFVSAYIIGYKGESFVPASFVISAETHQKLAGNVKKNLKFGDLIQVFGKVINSVEVIEVEQDNADDWGSDESAFDRNTINNYISELRITGVKTNTWEKKKYTENDFVKDEAEEDWGADDSDNPFASDDEELPFDLD